MRITHRTKVTPELESQIRENIAKGDCLDMYQWRVHMTVETDAYYVAEGFDPIRILWDRQNSLRDIFAPPPFHWLHCGRFTANAPPAQLLALHQQVRT